MRQALAVEQFSHAVDQPLATGGKQRLHRRHFGEQASQHERQLGRGQLLGQDGAGGRLVVGLPVAGVLRGGPQKVDDGPTKVCRELAANGVQRMGRGEAAEGELPIRLAAAAVLSVGEPLGRRGCAGAHGS